MSIKEKENTLLHWKNGTMTSDASLSNQNGNMHFHFRKETDISCNISLYKLIKKYSKITGKGKLS